MHAFLYVMMENANNNNRNNNNYYYLIIYKTYKYHPVFVMGNHILSNKLL